ncbi:MAG TPA: ethylbenzene dehydrogenase-related protein [Terriglobia bacterium]|nr:ethylbenzene dehydrogenase-related protein [Terriglobia bacterium]
MRWLVVIVTASLFFWGGCRRVTERTNEVVTVAAAKLPLEPQDAAWDQAPEHVAKLLLQDLVEPRLMTPSTPEVQVRSLTNGSEIAFRLQWADLSQSDLPGPASFVDACAIQIPSKIETDIPEPQMGKTGRPVEITYWRADWQASVNGRPDTLQALYPNAAVDHYPFEAKPLESDATAQKEMAKRYAPAEAVGNRRAGPRLSPVEDMIAEGPGTLSPSRTGASSRGKGIRTRDGWSVVVSRRLPEGLTPRVRTQIAFAVWEGAHGEVGARKMRTGWIPLATREAK